MMWHKLILTTLTVIAFTASSNANSLLAPIEGFDWAGVYVGAHVGDGDADFDISRGSAAPPGSPGSTLNNAGGTPFGLLAGINFQHDMFVFGVEGDVSFGEIDKNNSFTLPSMDVGTFGSIRGRAGIAYERFHFFTTLGLSVADVNASERGTTKDSRTHVGTVAGLGAEFAVTFDNQWAIPTLPACDSLFASHGRV